MVSPLVPSPVSNLSVTAVSTTGITLNWTIPSNINYVTHYTISYTPSCIELSSGNERISVSPHQSTTTYSYTLTGLHSGVNYTITVRAGNVLGESDLTSIEIETSSSGKYSFYCQIIFCIDPIGVPVFLTLTKPINNLTWNKLNCSEENGITTSYTVLISNSSITYNISSTNTHIILNGLVFGTMYNISVAAVNSIGRGPFSNPIVVEIGISE